VTGLRRAVCCAPVVALLIVSSACTTGGSNPQTQADGQLLAPSGAADGLAVTFGTEPAPPAKGNNQVLVTVKRPDGTPVTEGTVTAVFSMPAMPSMNMPAMRTEASLTHAGEGRYRGTSQLSMGGTWNVSIAIAEGGKAVVTRQTSIVAKE
jgi:nitrogen fixation protein FixH